MTRRVAVLVVLAGCAEDLQKVTDTAGAPVPTLQVSVEAALQQSGWGTHLGRCEVNVTFTHPPETDGMYEQPAQLWDPLNIPDRDGDCALTLRDPAEMQAALDAQGTPPDNWTLTGTVDVGAEVQLVSDAHTLTLAAEWNEDGTEVRYGLEDCAADTFPRSEAFDLVVAEGAPDDGIEPFTLDDVLAAGPGLELTGIGRAPGLIRPALVQGRNAPIRWSFDRALPTLDRALEHEVRATVRNCVQDGIREFEGLVCVSDPADGTLGTEVTLSGAALARMTPDRDASGDLYLSLQLDSITTGPEVTAPWGQRIRVQSVVSIDGFGALHDSALSASNAE